MIPPGAAVRSDDNDYVVLEVYASDESDFKPDEFGLMCDLLRQGFPLERGR
ncbi:MAG: hypothetical protein ACM3QU_09620 [Verrucomicrobiota bacterium]